MIHRLLTIGFLLTCKCAFSGISAENPALIRADSLFDSGSYTEAANAYSFIFQEIERENKGSVSYKTALSFFYSGNIEKATEWFERSARSFAAAGDTAGYFKARSAQATIYDETGAYAKARAYSAEVSSFFYSNGKKEEALNQLLSLALYFYHDDLIREAVLIYAFILSESPEDALSLRAKSYNQLGNIYAVDLNDEERALEFYRRSLHLKIQGGAQPQSIVASFNNLGLSHKNLGELDSAELYYRSALEMARSNGIPKSEVDPLINLGNLKKRKGNTPEALTYYAQALKLEGLMNVRQRNTLHTNLGILEIEQGNFSKALAHLNSAEAAGASGLNFFDNVELTKYRSQAYAGIGDYVKAFKEQSNLISWLDSIALRNSEQELNDLRVRYETAETEISKLAQERVLKQKELELKNRTIWLLLSGGLSLFALMIFYILIRKKESAINEAKNALLLAEQEKTTKIQAERLRISRELHDNLGAYLTVMSATLDPAREERPEIETRNALREALSLSMRELRKTVWLLNRESVHLDELLLRLRDFFSPLNNNGQTLTFACEGGSSAKLSELQTTHLFRLIQEAVNNACKHGNGSKIDVVLKEIANNKIQFEIHDNGTGFDIHATYSGNGLANLHTRARELNGELKITSTTGHGCSISGSFPLKI